MDGAASSQTASWLILNASGLTALRQCALVEAFGDADGVLGADDGALRAVEGIDAGHVARLREAQTTLDVAAAIEKLHEIGGSIVPITDESYPPLLREIPDPPVLLFVSGRFDRRDELAVGIVGTRGRTDYGQRVAEQLSAELVRRGFTVVSGLALGIDTDAHRAALDAGGRTIAVTACGLDVDYPSENRHLRERIAGSGAVITELALGTPALRERFPARNRIIAGLARGTLVVEAPMGSGALITARLAIDQGREVFALPGPVGSPYTRGTHDLIKRGQAKLVENVDDILVEYGATRASLRRERTTQPRRAAVRRDRIRRGRRAHRRRSSIPARQPRLPQRRSGYHPRQQRRQTCPGPAGSRRSRLRFPSKPRRSSQRHRCRQRCFRLHR